jgi:tetratricopeptide (TPR) repeat protein
LRTALGRPDQAEQFLREGLRANTNSYELLLELGYVYDYNKKDFRAAHNLFDLARQKWKAQDDAGLKPSPKGYVEILDGLVRADEDQNNLKELLADLEALKAVSPNPEAVEKTIQETRSKLAAAPPGRPD